MPATLLHILAALALAIVRGPRAAWLRYELWELEHWVADIQRDLRANGIDDTQHLRDCRAREAELRVRLALLQPAPAEAATEVGLDLDGDGHPWYPAPPGTLCRPQVIVVATLLAAAAGLIWGPDLGPWIAAQWVVVAR